VVLVILKLLDCKLMELALNVDVTVLLLCQTVRYTKCKTDYNLTCMNIVSREHPGKVLEFFGHPV